MGGQGAVLYPSGPIFDMLLTGLYSSRARGSYISNGSSDGVLRSLVEILEDD